MLVRGSMHQIGATTLSQLLSRSGPRPATVACACVGQVYFHDTAQATAVGGGASPPAARLLRLSALPRRAGSPRRVGRGGDGMLAGRAPHDGRGRQRGQFRAWARATGVLAGLEVTTKAVERHAKAIGDDIARGDQAKVDRAVQWELPQILGIPVAVLYMEMDGTQVPMVRAELEGRTGRIDGQPARTREVKLGCVFTQTPPHPKGRPIRDEASTTYVGALETAEQFGRRLYTEACERGWSRAAKKVVLGDGADWIWNIAGQHFPGAVQIIDIWHAREHLWNLAARLFPADDVQRKHWAKKLTRKLNRGSGSAISVELRAFPTRKPDLRRLLRSEADYFERNRLRMRYPQIPQAGSIRWFGSDRGGMQNRHRVPPQTVWHVLDRAWRQRHDRVTLPPPQPQIRGPLGFSVNRRRLNSTFMSHTREVENGPTLAIGDACPGAVGAAKRPGWVAQPRHRLQGGPE